MAKIKIKGEPEMIAVPNQEALNAAKGIKEGVIKPDDRIRIGRFEGIAKNILHFIFDEKREVQEDHNMEDYIKARETILTLPLKERLKKQKGWYNFICHALKYVPSDQRKRMDIIDCEVFLQTHPYRMWMDPLILMTGWGVQKSSADARAFEIIERVVRTDRYEERMKLEEIENLTSREE